MKILNIYDPNNTFLGNIFKPGFGLVKRFRRDGAEFKRRAGYCSDFYRSNDHKVLEISIEGKNAFEKRMYLFSELSSLKLAGMKFDRVNFFCHGAKYNLNRKMISKLNIGKFASKKLAPVLSNDAAVVLYSCKTALVGLDGFATALQMLTGSVVVGHKTSGHTTNNLTKKIFSTTTETYLCPNTRKARRTLSKEFWSNRYAAFMFVEDAIEDSL